eukprot:11460496-Ditylum_brightwellii.AAC.1
MPWDDDVSYGHDDDKKNYDIDDYDDDEDASSLLNSILDTDSQITPDNVRSALPSLLNSQAG